MKNSIGLDKDKAKKLAEELNILLANYQVFYINTRGFHWNITGQEFFELHAKFEEIYNDALIKVDEIAERIRTLGHTPLHTFTDYLKAASIKEAKGIKDGKKGLALVVSAYQALLEKEREILSLSQEAGDEATLALMSDYMRQQEKQVWMYSAYLA